MHDVPLIAVTGQGAPAAASAREEAAAAAATSTTDLSRSPADAAYAWDTEQRCDIIDSDSNSGGSAEASTLDQFGQLSSTFDASVNLLRAVAAAFLTPAGEQLQGSLSKISKGVGSSRNGTDSSSNRSSTSSSVIGSSSSNNEGSQNIAEYALKPSHSSSGSSSGKVIYRSAKALVLKRWRAAAAASAAVAAVAAAAQHATGSLQKELWEVLQAFAQDNIFDGGVTVTDKSASAPTAESFGDNDMAANGSSKAGSSNGVYDNDDAVAAAPALGVDLAAATPQQQMELERSQKTSAAAAAAAAAAPEQQAPYLQDVLAEAAPLAAAAAPPGGDALVAVALQGLPSPSLLAQEAAAATRAADIYSRYETAAARFRTLIVTDRPATSKGMPQAAAAAAAAAATAAAAAAAAEAEATAECELPVTMPPTIAEHQETQQQQQQAAVAAVADMWREQQQQQQQAAQHVALLGILEALDHSSSVRTSNPCDPELLSADRRLAAATRKLWEATQQELAAVSAKADIGQ
jgi:hypothetical protein